MWRVGSKVPLNVYANGDRPVCQCHSVADAELIVQAVNHALHLASLEPPQPSGATEPEPQDCPTKKNEIYLDQDVYLTLAKSYGHTLLLSERLSAELSRALAASQKNFQEHTLAVGRFLSDMHATMVDPLAEGTTPVAEMMALLLETARRQRQEDHDLRQQLAEALAALDDLLLLVSGKYRTPGTVAAYDHALAVLAKHRTSPPQEKPNAG